jgi:hypothetical protein
MSTEIRAMWPQDTAAECSGSSWQVFDNMLQSSSATVNASASIDGLLEVLATGLQPLAFVCDQSLPVFLLNQSIAAQHGSSRHCVNSSGLSRQSAQQQACTQVPFSGSKLHSTRCLTANAVFAVFAQRSYMCRQVPILPLQPDLCLAAIICCCYTGLQLLLLAKTMLDVHL